MSRLLHKEDTQEESKALGAPAVQDMLNAGSQLQKAS